MSVLVVCFGAFGAEVKLTVKAIELNEFIVMNRAVIINIDFHNSGGVAFVFR